MSSRKVREKLRERRITFDRKVEENRRTARMIAEEAAIEEPKEEPKEEKKPAKKRGRPNKKKESK